MRGQTSTVVLAFLLVWALNLKLAELPIFRRQNRADDSVAPQPQPTPINDDLERGTSGRLPESDDHGPKIPDMPTKLQWGQMVIGVCFPAVNTALQALQTPAPLPRTFPWFYLTFELALFASLVSIYIRRRSEKASLILEHLAVLFGATAFLLAISMPLHNPMIEICIAVGCICFFIIIIANRSPRDWKELLLEEVLPS
ncbi:uncharacterized protein [Coffea arabica]|uniref:Uncharacterized protein n=1 Tax=Coffea arabica TaxID=13443 RepID=A0A6P6XBX8_COFAR|nr:uncharacterized protein LOC113741474 [Coffea arabica]